MMMRAWLVLVLPVVLAGCGGDKEGGDSGAATTGATGGTGGGTGGTGGGTTGAAIDCATDAWDISADMGWKSAWMGACMVPAIQPLMEAIDPDKYSTFGCSHCHGEDLGGGDFVMPGATELDWAAAGTWDADYYDGATFSGPMNGVRDATAALLGLEVWSDANPEGFACGGCHVGL
jgi:hypothetical protein